MKKPPVGPMAAVRWSPRGLPFVVEGTGDHLGLDFNPTEGGTVGQVFDFGHEEGPTRVLLPSFRAFRERYAQDLESGDIESVPDEDAWKYTDEVDDLRTRNPGQFDPPAAETKRMTARCRRSGIAWSARPRTAIRVWRLRLDSTRHRGPTRILAPSFTAHLEQCAEIGESGAIHHQQSRWTRTQTP